MIGLRRRALGRAQRWMTSETLNPMWAHDYPEVEDDGGRRRARRKKKHIGTPPELYDIYAPVKGIEPTFWHDILVSSRYIALHPRQYLRWAPCATLYSRSPRRE